MAEFRLHYRELLGHVRRLLDRLADCAKLIGMGSGVGWTINESWSCNKSRTMKFGSPILWQALVRVALQDPIAYLIPLGFLCEYWPANRPMDSSTTALISHPHFSISNWSETCSSNPLVDKACVFFDSFNCCWACSLIFTTSNGVTAKNKRKRLRFLLFI